jgi:hypothetical protein
MAQAESLLIKNLENKKEQEAGLFKGFLRVLSRFIKYFLWVFDFFVMVIIVITVIVMNVTLR